MDDDKSDCYMGAMNAGQIAIKAATKSNYNGGDYNSGDASNFANIFLIKLMTAMDKCTYTPFLVYIDNRMNDIPFLVGLGSNIVTQLAQYSSTPQPAIYSSGLKIFQTMSAAFSAFTNGQEDSAHEKFQLIGR